MNHTSQEATLEEFPTWQEQINDWQTRLAAIDWTPWLIVGLAAFLRFLLLGMKPPHFDEGINGWFVDQMVKNGYYRYDPTNYHGPLHFYVLFLFESVLGRNIWALRLPVVIISIACVWLTLKFEPFVGRKISQMAALAVAVSPGFIFYGRYSIHEVWLQLFSMIFVFGLLGLWKFGTPKYLWCTGMGIAGMILTKETYILHIGCALIAIPVTWIVGRLPTLSFTKTPRNKKQLGRNNQYPVVILGSYTLLGTRPVPVPDENRAQQTWDYVDLAMVIGTGVLLIVFFYSGTFLHWSGVKGLYQAYAAWSETGQSGHGHEKPWNYWLKLIARYEWPVLASLFVCLFSQFFKSVNLRYLAVYGMGTLIAYSIVRYKTPWCIISIVWPLLFVFGAASAIGSPGYRKIAERASYFLLCLSLASAISLNYFRCSTFAADDWDKNKRFGENIARFFVNEPYIYVQTYNDIFKLTVPVLELARRNPVFYQMNGHMIRPSAYPLPWILGDFPNIGYYEHDAMPPKLDADFLVVQQDKIKEVEEKLQKSYYTMPLTIRPYQDTSKAYFEANRFKDFFPNRSPDFIGKGSG